MPETVRIAVLIAGIVISTGAMIRLLSLAYHTRLWWGLVCTFFFLPMIPIFVLVHWKKTRRAAILLIAGLIVTAVPFATDAVRTRLPSGPQSQVHFTDFPDGNVSSAAFVVRK